MMAVGGLLVAIIIAGLIGFWQTRNIERVSAEALGYVELEDEGDDIRAPSWTSATTTGTCTSTA
jgi:hypothetical protein